MANNTTVGEAATQKETDTAFFYIQLVCYVIIFIVGVIGNVLVCLVVCRQRKMKNVTNYFIVNLAVADLSVLFICIPFDFGEQVTKAWPYGAIMCRLIYPLQTMATTASVGTLVAISLTRFVAIVYPLRPQLQTKDAKKVIFVIWVFALALVSPYIAVLQLDNNGQCSETFKEKGLHAWAYTIAILLLQYIIPLSVIGLCYIRIGRDLRRDKASYSNDALQRDQEREAHKVVKVLTVVVIVFALLMLPNHVVFLWLDFGEEHADSTSIMMLCQIFVYANSASNPLIYNAVNEQFREGFKAYFRSWIECILQVKCRKSRKDEIRINNQTILCKLDSDVSLNGQPHSPRIQSQINNNGVKYIAQESDNDEACV